MELSSSERPRKELCDWHTLSEAEKKRATNLLQAKYTYCPPQKGRKNASFSLQDLFKEVIQPLSKQILRCYLKGSGATHILYSETLYEDLDLLIEIKPSQKKSFRGSFYEKLAAVLKKKFGLSKKQPPPFTSQTIWQDFKRRIAFREMHTIGEKDEKPIQITLLFQPASSHIFRSSSGGLELLRFYKGDAHPFCIWGGREQSRKKEVLIEACEMKELLAENPEEHVQAMIPLTKQVVQKGMHRPTELEEIYLETWIKEIPEHQINKKGLSQVLYEKIRAPENKTPLYLFCKKIYWLFLFSEHDFRACRSEMRRNVQLNLLKKILTSLEKNWEQVSPALISKSIASPETKDQISLTLLTLGAIKCQEKKEIKLPYVPPIQRFRQNGASRPYRQSVELEEGIYLPSPLFLAPFTWAQRMATLLKKWKPSDQNCFLRTLFTDFLNLEKWNAQQIPFLLASQQELRLAYKKKERALSPVEIAAPLVPLAEAERRTLDPLYLLHALLELDQAPTLSAAERKISITLAEDLVALRQKWLPKLKAPTKKKTPSYLLPLFDFLLAYARTQGHLDLPRARGKWGAVLTLPSGNQWPEENKVSLDKRIARWRALPKAFFLDETLQPFFDMISPLTPPALRRAKTLDRLIKQYEKRCGKEEHKRKELVGLLLRKYPLLLSSLNHLTPPPEEIKNLFSTLPENTHEQKEIEELFDWLHKRNLLKEAGEQGYLLATARVKTNPDWQAGKEYVQLLLQVCPVERAVPILKEQLAPLFATATLDEISPLASFLIKEENPSPAISALAHFLLEKAHAHKTKGDLSILFDWITSAITPDSCGKEMNKPYIQQACGQLIESEHVATFAKWLHMVLNKATLTPEEKSSQVPLYLNLLYSHWIQSIHEKNEKENPLGSITNAFFYEQIPEEVRKTSWQLATIQCIEMRTRASQEHESLTWEEKQEKSLLLWQNFQEIHEMSLRITEVGNTETFAHELFLCLIELLSIFRACARISFSTLSKKNAIEEEEGFYTSDGPKMPLPYIFPISNHSPFHQAALTANPFLQQHEELAMEILKVYFEILKSALNHNWVSDKTIENYTRAYELGCLTFFFYAYVMKDHNTEWEQQTITFGIDSLLEEDLLKNLLPATCLAFSTLAEDAAVDQLLPHIEKWTDNQLILICNGLCLRLLHRLPQEEWDDYLDTWSDQLSLPPQYPKKKVEMFLEIILLNLLTETSILKQTDSELNPTEARLQEITKHFSHLLQLCKTSAPSHHPAAQHFHSFYNKWLILVMNSLEASIHLLNTTCQEMINSVQALLQKHQKNINTSYMITHADPSNVKEEINGLMKNCEISIRLFSAFLLRDDDPAFPELNTDTTFPFLFPRHEGLFDVVFQCCSYFANITSIARFSPLEESQWPPSEGVNDRTYISPLFYLETISPGVLNRLIGSLEKASKDNPNDPTYLLGMQYMIAWMLAIPSKEHTSLGIHYLKKWSKDYPQFLLCENVHSPKRKPWTECALDQLYSSSNPQTMDIAFSFLLLLFPLAQSKSHHGLFERVFKQVVMSEWPGQEDQANLLALHLLSHLEVHGKEAYKRSSSIRSTLALVVAQRLSDRIHNRPYLELAACINSFYKKSHYGSHMYESAQLPVQSNPDDQVRTKNSVVSDVLERCLLASSKILPQKNKSSTCLSEKSQKRLLALTQISKNSKAFHSNLLNLSAELPQLKEMTTLVSLTDG